MYKDRGGAGGIRQLQMEVDPAERLLWPLSEFVFRDAFCCGGGGGGLGSFARCRNGEGKSGSGFKRGACNKIRGLSQFFASMLCGLLRQISFQDAVCNCYILNHNHK